MKSSGSWWGVLLACLATLALTPPGAQGAEQKKDKPEEKKREPPRVALTLPLAVSPGTTNKLKIRGVNLTNVTDIRFTNNIFKAAATIQGRTKVEGPKDSDAKKTGDTQIEVELVLPADTATVTHHFVLTSPDGQSAPHPLVVLPAASLLSEKEPNGGFRQPQDIEPGRTVLAAIHEPNDVDVFRVRGRAGERWVAEVRAARLGSSLDSVLTFYDTAGHILATSDDGPGGLDSVLRVNLAVDGPCLLCVQDAHDRGGPAHAYLLTVTLEK